MVENYNNLILNAHAAKLQVAPEFMGQRAAPPFNNHIGDNFMLVTIPSNVRLVYYTDIFNMDNPECDGSLYVSTKDPGHICYGTGWDNTQPGLQFSNELRPKIIFHEGAIVPNMALWGDNNDDFNSGLKYCAATNPLINISDLQERWQEWVTAESLSALPVGQRVRTDMRWNPPEGGPGWVDAVWPGINPTFDTFDITYDDPNSEKRQNVPLNQIQKPEKSKILLSEVLNFVAHPTTWKPAGILYIHLLMCVGGITGADSIQIRKLNQFKNYTIVPPLIQNQNLNQNPNQFQNYTIYPNQNQNLNLNQNPNQFQNQNGENNMDVEMDLLGGKRKKRGRKHKRKTRKHKKRHRRRKSTRKHKKRRKKNRKKRTKRRR